MQAILIVALGAVVFFLLAVRGVLDMAATIEYAEGAFPFLARWAESKKWHRILLISTLLFYGGTLYELLKEPPPMPPITFADPGVATIDNVVTENRTLRAELAPFVEKESTDSLRRRTIKLVNDLNIFWSQRVPPQQQPVQNPSTEEDRKRNAVWDAYWRETNVTYKSRDFNGRILAIVREYKNKGIPIGFVERSAEQPDRLIGALPYGGYSLDSCDTYQNELCQLREMAFHVTASDQRIDPDF